MGKIFVTSDLHFGHDKEFLYKKRGFCCVEDMNNTLVDRWNSVVGEYDDVYMLGDFMLGQNQENSLDCIKKLKGRIHLCIGNHDTDNKLEKLSKLSNIVEIAFAYRLKYKKQSLFLTHYPTITSNKDDDVDVKYRVVNLHGHTHQETNFIDGNNLMYHVGVDSHNLTPVELDKVVDEIWNFHDSCEEQDYNNII